MHVFADFALARRLEGLVAWDMRRFAEAARPLASGFEPDWIEVAGGVATYLGPGSPLNQCGGLGFTGPVTRRDVSTIERFFAERDAQPAAGACPLADPSLVLMLAERGWTAASFENVLVREIDETDTIPEPDPAVEISLADSADERDLWAALAANGFAAPDDPTSAEILLGKTSAARDDVLLFIARVDGTPAGTGELHLEGLVGWLTADATLPEFRGRGVQQSLQRARLRTAQEAGCDLAATESVPGTGSQRNMERLGFRVAYTRVALNGPSR